MRAFFIPHPSYLIPIVCLVLAAAASCGRPRASSPAKQIILWHKLGAWSGRDDAQTESFVSNTGYLRITWETSHESKPDGGRFKLTVMSSISGRPLLVAVDFQGVGQNTAIVNEDPRTFYALVESSNVDWKFTVDEGVPATVQEKTEK